MKNNKINSAKKLILYVEDEEFQAKLFSRIIKSEIGVFDYEIVIFSKGGDFINLLNLRNEDYKIDFDESVYNAGISINREYNTNTLRFYYTSMTTPTSSFDFDMIKKSRVLLKQQEVLGGFDKSNYKSERVFATASDGTKIPISGDV